MQKYVLQFASIVVLLLSSCSGYTGVRAPLADHLAPQAVYGDRTVSFNSYPYGSLYTQSQFASDFGNVPTNYPGEKLHIYADTSGSADRHLRVTLQQGQTSSGGIRPQVAIANKSTYTLEYRVKFTQGYDWTKGGKLPGLCGGSCNTGGDPANGDGWSVRLMWAGPGYGGPGFYPYVYHMDPPAGWIYGDDLDGTADPTQFNVFKAIQAGQWYQVKLYVQLNTANNRDGVLRVWVDGQKVFERTNLRYRNDGRPTNALLFHVFHGGSTDDYEPDQTQFIRLDDVKWY